MEEVSNNSNSVESGINNTKYIPYNCLVEAIRTSLGMSRGDLARKIGTTYEFLCMVEHEKYYPVLTTRIKIARALSTPDNPIDTSALWILKEDQDGTD